MSAFKEQVVDASSKHPNPDGLTFTYGTAGFRMLASRLDGVVFRVALVAAARSANLKGQCVGVMITASHNPEQDNGVKIVDPTGEMLASDWEAYATVLANARSGQDIVNALDELCSKEGITLNANTTMNVTFGYDTRPSCPQLVRALRDGLDSVACKSRDIGLVTTPQLHFVVAETTLNKSASLPTVNDYYRKLCTSFKALNPKRIEGDLVIDCANGVGAPAMRDLLSSPEGRNLPLSVKLTNDAIDKPGALNDGCGADFVKTKQRAPASFSSQTSAGRGGGLQVGTRYCSFDGDADRIVYYYAPSAEADSFRLLDGDKIACLIASYLKQLVSRSDKLADLKVGIVQTAYANGASTRYISERLKLDTVCVATGVKHLHHAAKESYDIGVYFEANGHGTVLFSPRAQTLLSSSAALATATAVDREAAKSLLALGELINQTVGDAISDMLVIETVLSSLQLSLAQWDACYADLPNRLVKVVVRDRSEFVTTDAERRLVRPERLQSSIDELVRGVRGGRSFVRPSGTEDCVRVYAEAETRVEADQLAQRVANLVFDAAGSGQRPDHFD